jgi:omega-6 fatty acid desaturase (delta-12 desaturase)
MVTITAEKPASTASVRKALRERQSPILRRSLWQIANTFLPFFAVCTAMYFTVHWSFWATAGLAVIAAGLMVRIFIIQHDCGHGSFFGRRWANDALGTVCSLFTLTPYANWQRQHAGHHGNWNNLDRRESGTDIYSTCLTVAEYNAMSPSKRFWYRVVRHPIITLVLLPPLVFLVLYRLPFDTPKEWRKERLVVYLTNAALIAIAVGMGLAIGFGDVAMVQLPISAIAAVFGVWLFSIQHRFEGTLWLRKDKWDPLTASLQGSSFLRLPRVLQWFTGNIGYHHVHHLNSRVPNYRLQECHEAAPELAKVPTLNLWRGLSSFRYALWDEEQERMVRFPRANRRSATAAAS